MADLTVIQFFENIKNKIPCRKNFKDEDGKYLEDMIKELGYKPRSYGSRHEPAYTFSQRIHSKGTQSTVYELDGYTVIIRRFKSGRIPMIWVGFQKKVYEPREK